jgi:hypothetical protein
MKGMENLSETQYKELQKLKEQAKEIRQRGSFKGAYNEIRKLSVEIKNDTTLTEKQKRGRFKKEGIVILNKIDDGKAKGE